MEALADVLPENTPLWILVGFVLLILLRDPINKLLADKFPALVNAHFKAVSNANHDTREFEQTKELTVLQYKVASSEQEREAYIAREQQNHEMLTRLVNLLETTMMNRMDETDEKAAAGNQRLLTELTSIRESIEALGLKLDKAQRRKTQDILLERIEAKR